MTHLAYLTSSDSTNYQIWYDQLAGASGRTTRSSDTLKDGTYVVSLNTLGTSTFNISTPDSLTTGVHDPEITLPVAQLQMTSIPTETRAISSLVVRILTSSTHVNGGGLPSDYKQNFKMTTSATGRTQAAIRSAGDGGVISFDTGLAWAFALYDNGHAADGWQPLFVDHFDLVTNLSNYDNAFDVLTVGVKTSTNSNRHAVGVDLERSNCAACSFKTWDYCTQTSGNSTTYLLAAKVAGCPTRSDNTDNNLFDVPVTVTCGRFGYYASHPSSDPAARGANAS